jgi:hypothetical protein
MWGRFAFWLRSLNRAAKKTSGRSDNFKEGDLDQTISYWYVLMYLMEVYARNEDVFSVADNDISFSKPFVSQTSALEAIQELCEFKEPTVRRYLWDLKTLNLLKVEGRGGEAMISLSKPLIFALAETMQRWTQEFRDLNERYEKLAPRQLRARRRR